MMSLLVVKIWYHRYSSRTHCRPTITLSLYYPLNTHTNTLSTMGYASCYCTHQKVLHCAQSTQCTVRKYGYPIHRVCTLMLSTN